MEAVLSFAPGLPVAPQSAWSLLDDPVEWPAFGRPLGEGDAARWESQVVVEGMHCAACAFTVEAALTQVPGVVSAEVNAASRRARVVWSSAAVKPSRWFEASEAAGYRLVPAGDMLASARRKRESRLALWRWLVAGFCMMQVMMYAYPAYIAQPGDMTPDAAQLLRWASWVLTLPVMLFSCGPFFRSAWRDLRQRRIGMDLPVALGMAITFVVSSAATFDPEGPLGHELYFDSLTMFVFFLLTGRWLEARLRDRTAGALDALMNRLPDSVLRQNAGGSFERVAVRRLAVGDLIRVLPGEAFPADGTVAAGDTSADEALITGESRPVPRPCGARVLAGSHNVGAVVEVRVEALGPDTRFAQIVALMESASLQKPRLAQLADRAARPFLLAVLAAAAAAAAYWWPLDSGKALMVAVAVLIVTCPCALSLATPAAMLASAGTLARGGVLVRNLQALEALAAIDTVVFDKTGTLTRDTPRLDRVYSRQGVRPGDAVELAAALAAQSLHPASRALVNAWRDQHRVAPDWRVSSLAERAGQGLEGRVGRGAGAPERVLRLGSAAFCGVEPLPVEAAQVHLSDDQGWVASFVLAEDLREDAAAAVSALGAQGVAVWLLSGDSAGAAREVAARAGIAMALGDCTPEDKLRRLKDLQAQGQAVAMVGDGLNDGPVLACAQASFAFGRAVPLAQAQADFVVLGDALRVVPRAIAQARRTLRVVRQNLWWAAGYNAVCVPLAVAGWLPPWLAGLGMAASSLAVVLNAARLARQPLLAEAA
ncbi:heavy metal translocating P-type ATPase [Variovorax sp. M-6]|uniref:heavy metal translocating P-type ATPase n=1 Tax=Variovorax sp. M-6 TaxID=3233041 RepID=UPI003F9B5C24